MIPRPEHPRPQFERAEWLSLNGAWTFEFDHGKSGRQQGWAQSRGFAQQITVPFCPESALSGVQHLDFIDCLWYHRRLDIPAAWRGQLVLLHCGGVDYDCEVFVDGAPAGRHVGGSASFTLDLTTLVRPGDSHDLVFRVADDTRGGAQACGKQSWRHESHGCHYTRTTGIWQSVWLEAAAPCGLRHCQILPDLDGERFVLVPRFHALAPGLRLAVRAFDGGELAGEAEGQAADGAPLVLSLPGAKPWSPASPHLYNLVFEVFDGDKKIDTVNSYAGLRQVQVAGNQILLNHEPIYLRLVLDQGFYPDGIWTAPSDAALRRDIELAQATGFNGARLHQKVFEERFHYWADRLGYLTWGESASWGMDLESAAAARNFQQEWREIVGRDRNHPSIIAWTPFNETSRGIDRPAHDRFLRDIRELTRDLDPTRPVNDTSGYVHVETDLWTVHNYEQDPAKLEAALTPKADGGVLRNAPDHEPAYNGQPYLIDEFGGIKWLPPGQRPHSESSWGYGDAPASEEEFYRRLEGLVDAVLGQEHICGFCYTQLTDVEQEQNGIYAYDRSEKFDVARIARIVAKARPR